jgi:hypothetical protein
MEIPSQQDINVYDSLDEPGAMSTLAVDMLNAA